MSAAIVETAPHRGSFEGPAGFFKVVASGSKLNTHPSSRVAADARCGCSLGRATAQHEAFAESSAATQTRSSASGGRRDTTECDIMFTQTCFEPESRNPQLFRGPRWLNSSILSSDAQTRHSAHTEGDEPRTSLLGWRSQRKRERKKTLKNKENKNKAPIWLDLLCVTKKKKKKWGGTLETFNFHFWAAALQPVTSFRGTCFSSVHHLLHSRNRLAVGNVAM